MAAERYEVPPARLARWLDRWKAAAGPVRSTTAARGVVRFEPVEGPVLVATPPFGPIEPAARDGFAPELLLGPALRERTVGVLLVRLGGYAAGVFEGDRLVTSKVGRRLVHGRHRAGGSSQRRFERRRGEQARAALDAAAETALRVLGPAPIEALVLGGDRRAVDALREDPRLARLLALESGRFLGDVPDPRRSVLEATPERFRATVLEVLDDS